VSLAVGAIATPAALLASYLYLTDKGVSPLDVVKNWLDQGSITPTVSENYTTEIKKHGNLRGLLESEIPDPAPLPNLDEPLQVAGTAGNQTYSNTDAMKALQNVTLPGLKRDSEATQWIGKTGKGAGEKTGIDTGAVGSAEEWRGATAKAVRDFAANSDFVRGIGGMIEVGRGGFESFVLTVAGDRPPLSSGASLCLQSALRELNHPEDKTLETDRKTAEQEPEATRSSS
jgi:hypothetical protein